MTGIALLLFGNQETVNVTVSSITPASQSEMSLAENFNFPSACSLTVTGGTPSSINWGFLNIVGGTWSVLSGQGTLSATPRVTGVAAQETVSATFRCTVVVNGIDYIRDCTLTYFNENI